MVFAINDFVFTRRRILWHNSSAETQSPRDKLSLTRQYSVFRYCSLPAKQLANLLLRLSDFSMATSPPTRQSALLLLLLLLPLGIQGLLTIMIFYSTRTLNSYMIIYGSYNITVYSYSHEDNLDYIVRQVGYFRLDQ